MESTPPTRSRRAGRGGRSLTSRANDHVLAAAQQAHAAVEVHGGCLARRQPVREIGERGGGVMHQQVAGHASGKHAALLVHYA